ncbi:zinc-dependent metalloprotease family protein [Fictibacillus terranigra]|uniref:Zinc-dependent metalloprotease family protein n=1 Tax=Fictibacillus terranigra TaxID=3058424 RepID=A0ABT8EBZ1_9BACL|nr:zinc-dependent metalloprotease family protein [Fictibacillus sp. CENA-BCM004]MDN4075450.1 zinc-dependent metalloprotease family protein [Fictibacillus sp. CENA-BCM004]
MPIYTVNIYGIFTSGVASGSTVAQRRARLEDDVRRANEIWRLNDENRINFVIARRFIINRTVNATNMTSDEALMNGSAPTTIINQVRNMTNNAIGIYVIYLSGNGFSNDADSVGGAEPISFVDENNYQFIGQVALTDAALNSDLFAHEVGHVLFARYITNPQNNEIIYNDDDPTGPYTEIDPNTGDLIVVEPYHSRFTDNIMYPITFGTNRNITAAQLELAGTSNIAL